MELVEKFQAKAQDLYKALPNEAFDKYNVKRGLRYNDGTGVMAGLTSIGEVAGYYVENGEKQPMDGHLRYRGIDVEDIVKSCEKEDRFGYEEVVYLLLFGKLPNEEELLRFTALLGSLRELPSGFVEDMIMKAPSSNIMNKLARSVLVSYSYDPNPDDISVGNILRQSIELIARMPVMAAYGYQAKNHYYNGNSLYLHSPQPELSTAENFLYMIRPDNQYTKEEAMILDILLIIHAEHGGGNNSAFTTRVVSSSDTDTYSAIAAAIGSLKGPKHGGANAKVMSMMDNIMSNVKDWDNEDELAAYLEKILKKEAFDGAGLIYGMGHAVYTKSDPRAILLKERAEALAKHNPDHYKEFQLYSTIEKLTPAIFEKVKGNSKVMCANVDMYSGFVYKMLGIPQDLYTPLFAVSRIVGWCAHRLEEVIGNKKIIRPAYKSLVKKQPYVAIKDRD
ncbi:MAG: citrate/2-methylcitrate synthase [Clostridia bacterium]|nr:citrate/2-methylcitrate synthase [Clostridia bacterium]